MPWGQGSGLPDHTLNMADHDEILDKRLLRAWMESTEPYTIDVMYVRKLGYRAFIYDENLQPVWKSESRPSADKAKARAEGFANLYRWLGKRKLAVMTDPGAQIAYGIGEHQQRKATHG